MSKIEIKRNDLVAIYNTFKNFDEVVMPKFSFFVTRNVQHLKDEFESIVLIEKEMKERKLTTDYQSFIESRNEIINKYVIIDSKTKKPQQDEYGQFIFHEDDIVNVNKEIEDNFTKHEDVIKDFEDNQLEYNDILNEIVEVDVLKLSYEDFPQDLPIGVKIHDLIINHLCNENQDEIEKILFDS